MSVPGSGSTWWEAPLPVRNQRGAKVRRSQRQFILRGYQRKMDGAADKEFFLVVQSMAKNKGLVASASEAGGSSAPPR